MDEIKFTVTVRDVPRIQALQALVKRDHSNKSAVLNKALDLLIERDINSGDGK